MATWQRRPGPRMRLGGGSVENPAVAVARWSALDAVEPGLSRTTADGIARVWAQAAAAAAAWREE